MTINTTLGDNIVQKRYEGALQFLYICQNLKSYIQRQVWCVKTPPRFQILIKVLETLVAMPGNTQPCDCEAVLGTGKLKLFISSTRGNDGLDAPTKMSLW